MTAQTPRILIVNHAAAMGGAEMVLLDIARHLGSRCHVVLLSDGPLRLHLERAGIGVEIAAAGAGMMGVTRNAGGLRALGAIPSVLRAVLGLIRRGRDFDVLYANSQKAAIVTMVAGLLLRKRVVWHMHDILSAAHFAGLQRRLSVRLANRAASRVIVISNAARASYVGGGGDPSRVVVVRNGIDPALFDETPGEAPPETGSGGIVLLGLFGRIAEWKGQHVLIEALAHLPGMHALIVGDALFGEDAYKAGLHALAARLGVADRVRFLGHRDDIAALMKSVDLVVHCSTAPEPFGRVIVEAMLARRLVVASDSGASREILGEDYAGLATQGDVASLAATIQALLHLAPDAQTRIIDGNDARARAQFTLSRMMGEIDLVVTA